MATEAQVVANRRNAQKSTGPRTAEGKAAVSQNAVKHGLLAQADVIRGEDREEFELYREELFWELNPLGTMECRLAERIVSLAWRLRRAERIANEALDALLAKDLSSPLARLTQSLRAKGADQPSEDAEGCESDLTLGRMVVRDFSNARVLDRLLMYERRIESSLYRTMNELKKLRRGEKPEAHDAGIGCRVRRDARDDTRIAANGGHSPPYQTAGVTTSAVDCAKQSQSAPGDSVRCTPCESGGGHSCSEDVIDFAKQSQSSPGDGVYGTPCEGSDAGPGEGTSYGVTTSAGDCAKQSQWAGGGERRVATADERDGR
jgi:hypothetical protein